MHSRCIGAAALLLSVWALAAAPAGAITFQELYRPTVRPDAAAADRRGAATEAAMRRLLERVTGNRGAGLEPDLQDLVTNAASYVSSYATLDGGLVQVGFLPNRIDSALAERGRAVWGPERPLTLVWIAIDSGHGERTLLGADGSSAELSQPLSPEMTLLADGIRAAIEDVASERGLPIAWPLLDLQDLGAVTFVDVWGGFDQRIEEASQRYGADAILVGRVLVNELGNSVQWTLLRGANRAVTATMDAAEGLQWTADQYAQEFSVVGGVRNLRVVVEDVESLADYGRVMSYLGGLSSLQSIDVDSLDGDVLTLHVAARGDADVIERMFSLGRVLEPADAAGGVAIGPAPGPAIGPASGPAIGPTSGTGSTAVGAPLVFKVARVPQRP
jgi:hypothetical protein